MSVERSWPELSPAEVVAMRYEDWRTGQCQCLPADEAAMGMEIFALEFEALPVTQQPNPQWGSDMAYLLRRQAARLRGEQVEPWKPAGDRDSEQHPSKCPN